jgi:hypothetical protein
MQSDDSSQRTQREPRRLTDEEMWEDYLFDVRFDDSRTERLQDDEILPLSSQTEGQTLISRGNAERMHL